MVDESLAHRLSRLGSSGYIKVGADKMPQQSPAAAVAEFHQWAYSESFGDGAHNPPALRVRLHNEENLELVTALAGPNPVPLPGGEGYIDWLTEVAKELADVLYVAYGTAHSLGIPLDAVLQTVHAANMSKANSDGTPCLRADGKVLKGDNYEPPEPAIRELLKLALISLAYGRDPEEILKVSCDGG